MIYVKELTLKQINTALIELDTRLQVLESGFPDSTFLAINELDLSEINRAIIDISDRLDALP